MSTHVRSSIFKAVNLNHMLSLDTSISGFDNSVDPHQLASQLIRTQTVFNTAYKYILMTEFLKAKKKMCLRIYENMQFSVYL